MFRRGLRRLCGILMEFEEVMVVCEGFEEVMWGFEEV